MEHEEYQPPQDTISAEPKTEIKNSELTISFRLFRSSNDLLFCIEGAKGIYRQNTDGTIMGCITSPNTAIINHILVEDRTRNRGLGKKLLTRCEDELKKQGIQTIYARFTKPETVEFFLHNGYRIITPEFESPETQKYLTTYGKFLDKRVQDEEDFNKLRTNPSEEFGEIMLVRK